ncbi:MULTISPECIES: amidohydrolase family protein [Actinosynnema]|uniref:amidohydrolase family protein n=1 Tax=Actinosynnema TaxID=40566 RepID=UPI0020A27A4F|nr:amidohydrolase family protein [Actinosynnema pretiosum]MCP2099794.1 Cytosine/adenosine deaminase [Actinosynnema pretiosum]
MPLPLADLLITGGSVLLGDPLDGRFERADVLVRDGLIAAIGPDLEAPGAERVDATGSFVLPGFVDTHHHLWEASLRGLTADWSALDFFWGVRAHHAGAHEAEDVHAGTYAGAVAALDAGITTVLDVAHAVNTPEHAREGLRAVREAGVRALFCYGLTTTPGAEAFTAEQRRADLRALHTDEFTSPTAASRVRLGVAVNDIGSVPWTQTRTEFHLARELGLRSTVHARSLWGELSAPEITWLHRDGLLSPDQVHAHANAATDEELALLAEAGAAVSSTPETEVMLGLGYPVLARTAELGIPTGLGTDIQAGSPADPFAWMRAALQAVRGQRHQHVLDTEGSASLTTPTPSVRDVLHHATLGGARVLGLGEVTGSLEVGKAADVLVLRADGVHQRPVVDPVATVVLHSRASDVDTVLVGGEPVKRAGLLLGGRTERATDLADAVWTRLAPRIAARGGLLPPRPEGLLKHMAAAGAANAPEWATS